jgi:hypothetical protein
VRVAIGNKASDLFFSELSATDREAAELSGPNGFKCGRDALPVRGAPYLLVRG